MRTKRERRRGAAVLARPRFGSRERTSDGGRQWGRRREGAWEPPGASRTERDLRERPKVSRAMSATLRRGRDKAAREERGKEETEREREPQERKSASEREGTTDRSNERGRDSENEKGMERQKERVREVNEQAKERRGTETEEKTEDENGSNMLVRLGSPSVVGPGGH